MSKPHIQVFSSDPTLLSYLAHYLQARSCNIIEEERKFYLRSSSFEKLPVLPTFANAAQYTDGLGAVLMLICPEFNNLATSTKVEKCKRALLLILNGIIKLKYKDENGLERARVVSSEVIEPGIDYEIDVSGYRVYTGLLDLNSKTVIGAGDTFFRVADRKKPSTKKVWNIARKNPAVARTLYHYASASQDDRDNLNKVREEIEKDVGYTQLVHWVGQITIEEFQQWVHNAYVSGGKARHALAKSDLNKAKAVGMKTMSLSPIDFHNLLTQWLITKC
jgi:hypothetical protein